MTVSRFIIVAIDGGAASGKSSTSRALSRRFRLMHVDTGSHYRAVTHHLLEAGVDPRDTDAVSRGLSGLRLETKIDGLEGRLSINGRTVGEEIRRPAVNESVSLIAAQPAVRRFLLDYQRAQAGIAQAGAFVGLIMEGRDIGSVIFPDADFRFFLQADPEARARRRAQQGEQDQIHERDRMDTQRKTAPLVCPPGAMLIDSTHLTLDEVVERMAETIATAIAPAP